MNIIEAGRNAPAGPPSRAPRGEVLLVDDDDELRRAIGRVLRREGFNVELCADGPAATEALDRKRFDAVLSDVSMAGMNGVDLLRHIRVSDVDLPVVLLSGGADAATAIRAIEYGVYRYLLKPVDADKLVATIDKAILLYRMAQIRRDVVTVVRHKDQLALHTNFKSALDTLWMAFQPIARADGSLYGYEALLRSREPALPDPGAVLRAAEQLDRLDDVGRTVRERASAAFAAAPADACLFVNLHARDLMDPMLTSSAAPLSKIAHRVVLEITERAPLSQIRDVRGRIAELRAMGFRIAVDDLGAGYAGLGSFALLEPDVVKLDMALVRDVHRNPMKKRLVESMASFCRDMGIMVVGEGVETAEERSTLIDVGCDLLQGFLLGKPAPLPCAADAAA